MITFNVDTDGVSGDYSTLSASFSALPSSLGDDYTIDCYASTSVLDTTVALLTGITLNGHAITINRADENYELRVNSGSNALTIGVDNTTVKNLVVDNQDRRVLTVTATGCTIDGVVTKSSSGYTSGYGIGCTGAGATNTIQNCISYGYGASLLDTGIFIDNGTANIYNSVVYNCSDDGVFVSSDGTTTIKNSAVFTTPNDFSISGTATIDYCASDDGDGTNPVTPSNWADVFTDYTNFDFTLKSGSDLIDAGIGPSSDPNVPVLDKAGNTRSGTDSDIGAYEYVAAAVGNPWYYYAQQ